jgi:hypothetical protein
VSRKERSHDTPQIEPASSRQQRWSDLNGRWLKLNATWTELNQAEGVPDEVSDLLLDEESDLALKMAAAQPRRRYEVVQKLSVLEKYMGQHNWSDRRDWGLRPIPKREIAIAIRTYKDGRRAP